MSPEERLAGIVLALVRRQYKVFRQAQDRADKETIRMAQRAKLE